MGTELNYDKAKFFFENKITVHITLSLENPLEVFKPKIYNGNITKLTSKFLVLNEEVHGQLPVYFSEIHNIEPRKPKETKYGN